MVLLSRISKYNKRLAIWSVSRLPALPSDFLLLMTDWMLLNWGVLAWKTHNTHTDTHTLVLYCFPTLNSRLGVMRSTEHLQWLSQAAFLARHRGSALTSGGRGHPFLVPHGPSPNETKLKREWE